MARREEWVVRSDAWPDPVDHTYTDEEKARAAYDRVKFYDPANGWGVTLIHRVTESEVLDTTIPKGRQ